MKYHFPRITKPASTHNGDDHQEVATSRNHKKYWSTLRVEKDLKRLDFNSICILMDWRKFERATFCVILAWSQALKLKVPRSYLDQDLDLDRSLSCLDSVYEKNLYQQPFVSSSYQTFLQKHTKHGEWYLRSKMEGTFLYIFLWKSIQEVNPS